MAYGIKVSQPGKDVKSLDGRDLVFSSEWNTYKIKKVVSANLTLDEYGGTYTYNHNYGFIPYVWGYYKTVNGKWMPDGSEIIYNDGTPNIWGESFNISVGFNSLTVKIRSGWGGSRDIKIFIMEKI